MSEERRATRRDFLETAAGLSAATPLLGQSGSGRQVPHKPLGKTGVEVSALGVGGFHLGAAKDVDEVKQMVDLALDSVLTSSTTRGNITTAAVRSGLARRSRANETALF